MKNLMQDYLEQKIVTHLERLLREDLLHWKVEAQAIEARLKEAGLLPDWMDPRMGTPEEFAMDVLTDNDCIPEQSNLRNLFGTNWNPKRAKSPEELIIHLLP